MTDVSDPRLESEQGPADHVARFGHVGAGGAKVSGRSPDARADAQASIHLGRFVQAHPDHRDGRFLYAELLFRLHRSEEAQTQYRAAIRCDQNERDPDVESLIHCHGRLATIAAAADDAYELRLNRGIGLYWLAQARARLGEPAGDLPVESLLCQAAGELSAAQALRPDEARPAWYLHRTWRQLGQVNPSRRWLCAAIDAGSTTDMTATELGDLHFAAQNTGAFTRH